MPYIYKITNVINQKIYIGKTTKSVTQRWNEHCRDCNKRRNEKRPLYSAMRKYGIVNFKIETIEECNKETLSEREKYWIRYYNSFSKGYNATKGGDGSSYCDHQAIVALYQQGLTIDKIVAHTGYCHKSCRLALKQANISNKQIKDRAAQCKNKKVAQLHIQSEEVISSFNSITEAYKAIGKSFSGHIAEVCDGIRKSAYGYKWRYL